MAIYALTPQLPEINTDAAPPPSESEVPSNTPQEDAPDEIELVGPLSSIYTNALNLAFVKEPSSDVSQESSAANHVGQATQAIQTNADNEEDLGINQPDLYIYVTDNTHLTAHTTPLVFDGLRIAMDKYPQRVYVVIESYGAVNRFQGLLEQYLYQQKVPVYHTRQTALERLQEVLYG